MRNPSEPTAAPKRPRILIVDDSPDVRLAFHFMLEIEEFHVVEAGSGAEALRAIAREPFDVVLTDLYMPDVNGLELIRALNASPSPPGVIAMSGEPNRSYVTALEAAKSLGADAVLTKPFTRADLVRTIRSIVGGGPALAKQPRPPTNLLARTGERRKRERTTKEAQATSVVELLINDPAAAVSTLMVDLRAGGDVAVVGSLLETAVRLAGHRGVDAKASVERVKRDLRRAGYAF